MTKDYIQEQVGPEDVEAHAVMPLTADALLSDTFESGTILPKHLRGDGSGDARDGDTGARR